MSELLCEFWILNPALATKSILTSRPWQSQGLLYKHLCHSLIHWFINWLTDPLVEIYLRCRHAQMVTNCASSHKTNYIDIFYSKPWRAPESLYWFKSYGDFGCILPPSGVALGRVCTAACAAGFFSHINILNLRLVYFVCPMYYVLCSMDPRHNQGL